MIELICMICIAECWDIMIDLIEVVIVNTYELELYVGVRGLILDIDICWNGDYCI